MTKIIKMVMKGFKSFANKTEILFGDEFNCILGPNGSGKSNVLDSLCFVLGKGSSKALRAEKSSNLIYNGGKTKKPAKEGEVSIYFTNADRIFPIDSEEVKITRIITKSGQSKYRINDKTSTKSQILDLMSHAKINPDGYNIILQGDVVRFTEMPTDQRRKVIEEIAGINVYEEKKKKALNELDKVEEKLNGAKIILTEKETHLKELKKDRDQALKYKELSDQIKESKAMYTKIQLEKKEAQKEEIDQRKTKATEDFEKYDTQVKEIKASILERKTEVEAIAKEIEARGEKDQLEISKELENLRVEVHKNKERIRTCNNEIERVDQRSSQLKASKEELDEKIANFKKSLKQKESDINSKEKEIGQVDTAIDRFKKKHKLGEDVDIIDKEVENLDSLAEEEQKVIDEYRSKQQELIREKDKIEFMISSFDERISKVTEIAKEHKKELDELKDKQQKFKEATVELTTVLSEDAKVSARIHSLRGIIHKHEEELSKLNIRNDSVKEASMGSQAVDKILSNKRQFPGVHGTIASLGSVSSKYSMALEIAAGSRIQSLIVEDDAVAAKCIKYLKDNQLGIASFIPLNKIRAAAKDPNVEKLKEASGAVDLAINLVKFQPDFKKAFSYVLGNTLIVSDVSAARRIGIGQARMVTLEGDIVEASGAMQGGYRKKRRGIGFQEKEISKGIDTLEETLGELRSEYASLQGQKNTLDARIQDLRQLKATLEGEIIKQEKSLHIDHADMDVTMNKKKELKEQLDSADKMLRELQDKISTRNRDLAQIKIKKQTLKSKVMALRNPTVIAELNTLEQQKRKLREEITVIKTEMNGVDNQLKSIFLPEHEKISEILKQHEKETTAFTAEIKSLDETLIIQHKDIKEKEEKEKKFYAQFKELFAKRNKLHEEIEKYEDSLEKANEFSRKSEHRLNTIGLEDARIKAELQGIMEEYQPYASMDIKITKTESQLKQEEREFDRMRANLGSINMRALEVYEQVEKQFHELVEKKDSLLVEQGNVLKLMEEIDLRKKELFMKTFEIINKNFQNKFETLSTKGHAYLQLENEEDPFAGGVGVKVKLSGTKFMDIRSLSGGEKTMTALALIFAIQEHEPASFYILDEVDAALDKHNSEKLAHLVRQYCSHAQYIVISHNDGVITEADNLYGVSMNEHGITKVTSLKV